MASRAIASTSHILPHRRFISTTPRLFSAFEDSLRSSSSPSPFSSLPSLPSSSPSLAPPPPSHEPTKDVALLGYLARLIMRDGKLPRAHSHLTLMLDSLRLSTSTSPLSLLNRALEELSPSIRIVSRRKGTKSLPTPQPLTEKQRVRQAWIWLVDASEGKKGQEKEFGKRLAGEVLAVLRGESEALKKKEGRHTQGVTARANVGR